MSLAGAAELHTTVRSGLIPYHGVSLNLTPPASFDSTERLMAARKNITVNATQVVSTDPVLLLPYSVTMTA